MSHHKASVLKDTSSLLEHQRRLNMSSLSNRLKQMQQVDMSTLSDLSHLRLGDFEEGVVGFGKYMTASYQEAWQDQEWISFVVSRFANSTKETHRRLIRYVELQLEWHESHQTPIMTSPGVSRQPTGLSHPVTNMSRLGSLPKAKPKAAAGRSTATSIAVPVTTHLPDMESDWDELDSVTYHHGSMNPTPLSQDPNFQEMRERLLNMENVMGRVIEHLDRHASHTPVPEDQNGP